MNRDPVLYKHSDITEEIVQAFYRVYKTLGYGFLEKVYQNALFLELKNLGLRVVAQSPINVYYARSLVGEYYADLIVEDVVIVEIKAVRELLSEHDAQILNYLKATAIEVGLLLNFGPRPQVRRRVFSKDRHTGEEEN